MCIKEGLLAVGGFHGELVCMRLSNMAVVHGGRVTRSDNGITNGIEVCDGLCLLCLSLRKEVEGHNLVYISVQRRSLSRCNYAPRFTTQTH